MASIGAQKVWLNSGLDNATSADANLFRDEYNNIYNVLGKTILLYNGTALSLNTIPVAQNPGSKSTPFYPVGTVVLIYNSTNADEIGRLYRRTAGVGMGWLNIGHILGSGGDGQAKNIPDTSIANQSLGVIKIDTTVLPILRDTNSVGSAHDTYLDTLESKRGFIFVMAGVANYIEKSTNSGSTWTVLTTEANKFYAVQLDEGVRLQVKSTLATPSTALRIRGQVWSRQLSDTTDIKDRAVTTAKLADGSGTTVKHADNSVTGLKINENLFTKILQTTGTPAEVALDLGLIVDSGLHSGVIRVRSTLAGAIEFSSTNSGSFSTLTTNANTWYVTEFDENSQLQVNTSASGTFTVTVEGFGSFIPDRGIKSRHIGTGEINTDNMANDAINTAKIADGGVEFNNISETMFKTIYDGTSITGFQLQSKLDDLLGTDGTNNGTVSSAFKVNIRHTGVANDILQMQPHGLQSWFGVANIRLLNDLTFDSFYLPRGNKLRVNDGFGSSILSNVTIRVFNRLASSEVLSDNIANGAVTTAKLPNGAVTTAKLPDGAVTTAKLPDGAVTTAKLPNSAVTHEKIAGGAIQGFNISDDMFSQLISTNLLGASGNMNGEELHDELNHLLGTDGTDGGKNAGILKFDLRSSGTRASAIQKQTGGTGSWVKAVDGNPGENYQTVTVKRNDKLRVNPTYRTGGTNANLRVFTQLHLRSFGSFLLGDQVRSRNIADDAVLNENIASHDTGEIEVSSTSVTNLEVQSGSNSLSFSRIGDLVCLMGAFRVNNNTGATVNSFDINLADNLPARRTGTELSNAPLGSSEYNGNDGSVTWVSRSRLRLGSELNVITGTGRTISISLTYITS